MLYDLSNDLHAENFKKRCNLLYKKRCVVDLTEKSPQRTSRQNSYLHVILGYFGLQFGYTTEEVKTWYFKEKCNPALFVREAVDRVTGETRKKLRSTADLTTEEMTLAIERFRDWAAQTAGVYIPSSDEHKLIQQCEIETQRAKQYL